MKDEEMAEEYVFSNPPSVVIDNHSYFLPSDLKQAFLAGLKAGRPQWHDLRKDENDLPKENQKCYFIYSNTYDKSNKVIFEEGIIQVRTGVYSFFIDEETGEETTEPCFYDDINDDEIGLKEVYTWKEIVLPVLPTELPKKWVDNYEDYQNASNDITFSQYPVYRGK